ncbi:protein SLC31A2 [Nelusetta ayraudi]|uniref:protein SLC31A2 n=1 Tax=Nelusetta ayraudi TaxID=303726 RepID=UPI003F7008A0
MMSMTFQASSSVMLLFDFWDVHTPAGMALSVLVVLLLTVFYEVLKVWRVRLGSHCQPPAPPRAQSPSQASSDCNSILEGSPSESSLCPFQPQHSSSSTSSRLLLHLVQTLLHLVQVTLGYMLMLCVMTYNTWIFLGVVVGSALGYFVAYPLLRDV